MLAAILALPGCGSHEPITTGHVNSFQPEGSGSRVYYFLPRTIVTVDVEAPKASRGPGHMRPMPGDISVCPMSSWSRQ